MLLTTEQILNNLQAEVGPGRHFMATLDKTGDTKHAWDPSKAEEVAVAKATFDSLKKKSYIAYTVNPDGSKGEIMHEFNALAAVIIMSQPMVSG
jgi:hypothetical protein